MHFPWNRKYMEISFHVILTVLILIGLGAVLFWLPYAKNGIFSVIKKIFGVFAPVFWAFFFSLLLEPFVSFWQKQYEKNCSLLRKSKIKNRLIATAYTYCSTGAALYLICRFFAEKIGNTDIQSIASQIGDYIRRTGDIIVLLNLKLAEMGILQNVEGILSLWTDQITQWIEGKILGLANIIPAIGSSLFDIFIGLAAAFYCLTEKKKILAVSGELLRVFLGKKATNCLKKLFFEIYSVFFGYLGGQMLDAIIMTILFSLTFWLVGYPHAIFLGLLSGFSNLIPYFGAIMAFILAVITGLVSGTPMKALYASIFILLLQQVDSMLIVPKVVGKQVELPPILVLLSLAVFGRLFGFWGLVFAVPLGALCKKLIYWLYERKKLTLGV